MIKQLLVFFSFSFILNTSAQSLIYETGEGTSDPWTGWTVDSSSNCITSSISPSYYWDFTFDTQTMWAFYASLTKQIDLTPYNNVKLVYKLNYGNNDISYDVSVSSDGVSWSSVASQMNTTTIPIEDSVIVTQPVMYIKLSMNGENLSPIIPFAGVTFKFLKVYEMSTFGIDEITQNEKKLVRITDLMGRETEYQPNTPLIYIYSDGYTEKVFRVE